MTKVISTYVILHWRLVENGHFYICQTSLKSNIEKQFWIFLVLLLMPMPCISGPDLTSDGEGISKILSGHITFLQNILFWTHNIQGVLNSKCQIT